MSNKVLKASLLRSIRFEHWLRFFFAESKGQMDPDAAGTEGDAQNMEAVYIVPEIWKRDIHLAHKEMVPLLDALHGRSLSLPVARDCVLTHTAHQCGFQLDAGFFGQVEIFANEAAFKRQLDLFHGWVQELLAEEHSANNFFDAEHACSFTDWESTFSAWAEAVESAQPQPPTTAQ